MPPQVRTRRRRRRVIYELDIVVTVRLETPSQRHRRRTHHGRTDHGMSPADDLANVNQLSQQRTTNAPPLRSSPAAGVDESHSSPPRTRAGEPLPVRQCRLERSIEEERPHQPNAFRRRPPRGLATVMSSGFSSPPHRRFPSAPSVEERRSGSSCLPQERVTAQPSSPPDPLRSPSSSPSSEERRSGSIWRRPVLLTSYSWIPSSPSSPSSFEMMIPTSEM